MNVNFECPQPDCDANSVDEIVGGVTQASVIDTIHCEGGESVACEYGDSEYDYDDSDGVICFRCHKCGFILKGADGLPITTAEELMVWLNERDMLKA